MKHGLIFSTDDFLKQKSVFICEICELIIRDGSVAQINKNEVCSGTTAINIEMVIF